MPGLSAVVTLIFNHAPVENLVAEHQVFTIPPLMHSKLVTRPDWWDGLGMTPCSGVSLEDSAASVITPVNLELYIAEGESGEGSFNRHSSGVECTFQKIRL